MRATFAVAAFAIVGMLVFAYAASAQTFWSPNLGRWHGHMPQGPAYCGIACPKQPPVADVRRTRAANARKR
jgi:hypothetical protein